MVRNRKLEDSVLPSNLLVHRGESVQFVFNVLLVLGVQVAKEILIGGQEKSESRREIERGSEG